MFLLPSLSGGGAERTLINILKNFDYSKFIVHLVIVDYRGVYKNKINKNVKVIPLFKRFYLLIKLSNYLQKKLNFNFFLEYYFKKKTDKYYDTAISFLDSNFTDLLFSIPNVKKRITWVHSSYKTNNNFYKFYKNKEYRDRLVKDRYSKLDSIVFVSRDSKKEFIELFGQYKRMPVIYNFLNEKEIPRVSIVNKPKKAQNQIKFIALGSLYPVKGYDLLISATEIVEKKYKNFKIEIYGKGFLEYELKNLIKKKNLQKFIKFKGFTTNPYSELIKTDVFIMTSRSEAMPLSLCEAMVMGKPVLVTNASGCREVVDYGKYGLMAETNAKSIAEKMELYICDQNLLNKYSNLSIERGKIFSDDKILNEIYSEIENS